MLTFGFITGLAALLLGGDFFVRGSVAIAQRAGMSPLLIGLTLVGFGTSTPELVTSLKAAFAGSPGIAVGNVVGSNTANLLLILGLAGIVRPIALETSAFHRDGIALALATLICIAVVLNGDLTRLAGLALIALLIGYVVAAYLIDRKTRDAGAALHRAESDAAQPGPASPCLAAGMAIGGLGLTIWGAHALVESGIAFAEMAGVSETVIGLTVVAVGTSLPELVVSVMAALRRHMDVALGNVIGSNIYNVLGILGITALIRPIAVPREVVVFDVWVMTAATVVVFAAVIALRGLTRPMAVLFVLSYFGYVGSLALR